MFNSIDIKRSGDVLNILTIINEPFYQACYEVFNPRNNMYISHNNGLANPDVCVQRDTVINANTLLWLGRKYFAKDTDRITHIESILKKNEEKELSRRDQIIAEYASE